MDLWNFVDQKKASDPPAVVILPFGEIEPGFWVCFSFGVVLRETADCSLCLELVPVSFVPVPLYLFVVVKV